MAKKLAKAQFGKIVKGIVKGATTAKAINKSIPGSVKLVAPGVAATGYSAISGIKYQRAEEEARRNAEKNAKSKTNPVKKIGGAFDNYKSKKKK